MTIRLSESEQRFLAPKPKTVKGPKFLKLRFGGGLHSRASEEDIDPRECSDGENFALDADNQQFRPRNPFDLIGTVPNGGQINGAATLLKSDGTVSTLIQGGNTVYEWDGATGFTSVGTVSSSARIRGRLEHNWQLEDKVLITDLALADVVKEWNGTTFQSTVFTDEEGYSFGTFRARYCYVSNERAIFANVHSNGLATPHLIVGSQRGNYEQISIVNRPSSAISAADPWFLVQPDNQYVNGIVEAFGQTVISSKLGSLYKLTGNDGTDFKMELLGAKLGSSSDEGLQVAANDIVVGSQGKLESVSATQEFGDIEGNDLSFWISDQVQDYGEWIVASNKRLQRTYFHPVGGGVIYTLHHSLLGSEVSPWSKWTTGHSIGFNPTFMMNVLDPVDGLEYVIMGDASGNVYRLEGSGSGGDGGTTAVTSFRLSGLISAETEGKVFENEGYIRYRRQADVSLVMRFEYSGEHVFNESITFDIPGTDITTVFGSGSYFGGEYYFGYNTGGLIRQKFAAPGSSNDFQVRITVEDVDGFVVNEIGLRYEEAT